MTTTTPRYIDSRHLAEILKMEHSAVLGCISSYKNQAVPVKLYIPAERMLKEKSRVTDIMHPYAELTFVEAKVLSLYMMNRFSNTFSFAKAEQVLTYIESVQDGDLDNPSES